MPHLSSFCSPYLKGIGVRPGAEVSWQNVRDRSLETGGTCTQEGLAQ
jgi:hypothetical protein